MSKLGLTDTYKAGVLTSTSEGLYEILNRLEVLKAALLYIEECPPGFEQLPLIIRDFAAITHRRSLELDDLLDENGNISLDDPPAHPDNVSFKQKTS